MRYHRQSAVARALGGGLALALIAFVGCGGPPEDTTPESAPAAQPADAPVEAAAEPAQSSGPSADEPAPAPQPRATRPADATPPPQPEPEPAAPSLVIPAETSLLLETAEKISTSSHAVGDSFGLTLMQNVTDANGEVLIPAGGHAIGRITEARQSTSSEDPAVIRFTVESVLYEDTPVPLTGEIVEAEIQGDTRTSTGRTAAIIGGASAAGALIGRVAGGDTRDAVIGAVAGAAAGTAYWLVTRDGHAELPQGSTLTFFLNEPVVIR